MATLTMISNQDGREKVFSSDQHLRTQRIRLQNLYEFDVARCSPRARILRYKYSASDAKDRFRLIHGSQVTVVLEHVSHLLYVHKGCIGNGLPCALSIWAFGSGACLRRKCHETIFPCLCLFPSPPLVGASKVQVRLGCGHPGYASPRLASAPIEVLAPSPIQGRRGGRRHRRFLGEPRT